MFQSISSTFMSTTSRVLKGKLPSITQSLASNVNNSLLSNLVAQSTLIEANVDRANSFISLFSLLADKIGGDDSVVISDDNSDVVQISDAATEVREGVDFFKENFGDCTFTDSLGLLYNFCFDVGQVNVNSLQGVISVNALIASSTAPLDIRDCVVYEQDGVMYLNRNVRSANFIKGTEMVLTTGPIENCIRLICHFKGLNYDGTLLGGYSGTLLGRCSSLGQTKPTILGCVQGLMLAPEEPNGKVRYLWDLVREYAASSELNSILLEAVRAVSQGFSRFELWLATSAASILKKVSCVVEFYNHLKEAYIEGGFKGAIMYLYSYFRTTSSALSEDGLLKFTDNGSLVPAEYIVGMIGQIVTTAVAAAGAIVSYFQPIIGAVISLVGSLGYGIFKSISYDQSQTRAGIQMSDRVGMQAFPHAICQGSAIPEDDFLEYINMHPVCSLVVPGGYLLVGPGSYSSDGKVSSVNFEFHPSCENNLKAGGWLANQVCTINFRSDNLTSYFMVEGSSLVLNKGILETFLSSVYHSGMYADPYVMANSSNDRVSEDDDVLLRRILLSNCFIFLYWAATSGISGQSETVYPVRYSHAGSSDDSIFAEVTRDAAVSFDASNAVNAILALAPVTPAESRDFTMYVKTPSWTDITSDIVAPSASDGWLQSIAAGVIYGAWYYGLPINMPTSFDYAIVPAKYNASTFLTWIAVTTIVAVSVAIATVVITFKVRKFIQQKRSEQNKNVEAAWEAYKSGDISYDDYRSTVRTANRWRLLVGGTKYDYENYWNGDVSNSSSSSSDQSSVSGIKSLLNSDESTDLVSVDGVEVSSEELALKIYHAIVG